MIFQERPSEREQQHAAEKGVLCFREETVVEVRSIPCERVQRQCESQLYIFEDIEAVIKMIVTGPSPTMRNVTRTHRVVLDWLFDRINLGPKIHIRYADTKRQLADTLNTCVHKHLKQHPVHWSASASSRESAAEPRGNVVLGKHRIHKYLTKDRNCDSCMRRSSQ